MGLGDAAVKIYLELRARGLFDVRSVVELGSQELHLSQQQLESLLAAAAIPVDDDRFAGLASYPAGARISAQVLYELLGATEYRCVDLNGEHHAIAHDLNTPFEDRSLWGTFDLVTDHGAAEHAFDVAEAYRTVHRLCRPGGLIIAIQAVVNGNGYYCFEPSFYEGLAAANGYKILFSSYVIGSAGASGQHHVPLSEEVVSCFDSGKLGLLAICYVLQRTTDADFVTPYQGAFLSSSQGHLGFQAQFLPAPPARTWLPMPTSAVDAVPSRDLASALARRVRGRLRR
jgi:SAM-dependent methyltransferase